MTRTATVAIATLAIAAAVALNGCTHVQDAPAQSRQTPMGILEIRVGIAAGSDMLVSPAFVAIEPIDTEKESFAWTITRESANLATTMQLPYGDYVLSLVCPIDSDGTVYTPTPPVQISVGENAVEMTLAPGAPLRKEDVTADILMGMASAAKRCHNIDPIRISQESVEKLESIAKNALEMQNGDKTVPVDNNSHD